MPAEKPADPRPSIGRIVTFRNRAGVDLPAIITQVTDQDNEFVQLTQFPPPHQGVEHPSDREWGFQHEARAQAFQDEDGHRRSCWRWPERQV